VSDRPFEIDRVDVRTSQSSKRCGGSCARGCTTAAATPPRVRAACTTSIAPSLN
jgi:hypothetical protein